MDSLDTRIRKFFKSYETLYRRALKDDVNARGVADHFAAYFVESSPGGAHGGKNGWLFRFMIGRGFAFYRKLGTRAMTLEVTGITPIDAHHAMVTVAWEAQCVRRDGTAVTLPFTHIYFLREEKRALKIFSYIANDQQKMLEEHGLVPKKKK